MPAFATVAQLAGDAFGALFALVFAAVGGLVVYRGLTTMHRGVVLWRSDPLSVYQASLEEDGAVELVGTARPAEGTIDAPFTGTDCLVAEWEVEEYDSSGDDSSWETIASGVEQGPFRVEDDTGTVLVEPDGAELALADGAQVEVGRDETAGEPIASFLDGLDRVEPGSGGSLDLGPLSVSTGDRRRYTEERLDVGETVHVHGPVESDADAGGEWGSRAVEAAIRDDAGEELFVVSDTGERSTVLRSLGAGAVQVLFGLPFLGVGLFVLFGAAGSLFV